MIYYLPLEPYQERNTYQLQEWTETAFKRNDLDFRTIIPPGGKTNSIIQNTGPLDYWRRTRYALAQTELLLQHLQITKVSQNDVIYAQDMFHPGIEALFYIYSQKPKSERPRIFLQNCAQSVDIYDFTYGMKDWMRHFEKMCDGFIDGTFVASSIHAELMRVAGMEGPIYVTGLPFDIDQAKKQLGKPVIPWQKKKDRIVFTGRFDKEKQPNYFMDFVEHFKKESKYGKQFTFSILQGGKFNSNHPPYIARARKLEREGKIVIHENLSKSKYYEILNDSKIMLNTALQDFVSTTLNEASAFSVKPLVPAFRAFPEAMGSLEEYMYIPWSHDSMLKKLEALIEGPLYNDVYYPAKQSHLALDKVCDIFDLGDKELYEYRIF